MTLYPEGLKIDSKKGLGYGISLKDTDRLKLERLVNDKVFSKDKEETEKIEKIACFIMGRKRYTALSLANELYLSETALRNQLEKVKKYITRYNLKLTTDRSSYLKIVGSFENLFRLRLNILLNSNEERSNTILRLIKEDEKKIVSDLLKLTLYKKDIAVSDFEISLLERFILLSIEDIREGRTEAEENLENKKVDTEYFTEELLEKLKEKLSIRSFYGYRRLIEESLVKLTGINDSSFPKLKSDVRDFLISYKNDRITQLTENEELLNQLIVHIRKFIERSQEDIEIENPIITDIKRKFPLEFNISYQLCKFIESKYPCVLSENEVGFIAIYLATQKETLKRQRKRIVIICHYGVGTAQLLKEKIVGSFEEADVIGVYPYSLRELAYEENPDVIVTSVKLEDTKKPVVFVKNIFSEEFLSELRVRLLPDREDSLISLLTLVNEDCFLEVEASDYKQAIEIISKKLQEKKIMNKEVQLEILKREEISSTEVGNLTAIPHTVSSKQDKSFVSVTKLKKAVKWGNETAQLIFLSAFSEKDKENLMAFRKLYRVISKHENVDELLENFSYINFLNMIKEN